jgi:hypothetical protein
MPDLQSLRVCISLQLVSFWVGRACFVCLHPV